MKKRSKVISLIVCMFAALFCFGAVAFANADSPILVTDYPSEFVNGITTVGFHFNQQAGVNDMTNLEGKTMSGKAVKEYFYYNDAPIDTGVINLHWLSHGLAVSINGTSFKVGDTMELKKGFPIPNADGTSDHEVGESVKLVYTTSGWIRTAETGSTESTALTAELVSTNPQFGGQSINISGYSVKRAGNYSNIQDWKDLGHSLSELILLNGEPVNGQFGIHIMSGNLYIYPNAGFSFATGDTITLKAGLHFPGDIYGEDGNRKDYYGPTAPENEMVFCDYLGADFNIKLGVSGWAVSSDVGALNSLTGATAIEEVPAGATMPATYDFNLSFKLEIAESELNGLQDQDKYSTLIKVGDKTVKEWNAQFADLKNEDGENIPAISLSAYGTGLKFSIVQSTNIIDLTKSINVTIGKDFVSETGHYLKEDIVQHYIAAFKYWSSVAPTEITKTDVNAVADYSFALGDNGTNGWFLLTFKEAIADGVYVEYGSSPTRQKHSTVGWPVERADYFASTGITYNLLTHIEINGKTLYEAYGEDKYTANTPLWQIHVNADGAKKMRIASPANTGFNTDNDQVFTLKEGLMFVNGTYLAEDFVLKYTAATKSFEVVSGKVVATSIALDKESETLWVGDETTLVATIGTANATETVTWSSSDPTVATVEDGKVKALKAGTATITATVGDLSAACEITANEVVATGITLSKTTETIKVGSELTLTATVAPENTTNKTVTWTSSDSSVATVDANGKVTALKVGTATITATCGEAEANCAITVEAVAVTGVTLDKTSATLGLNDTTTFVATVMPENATDKTVTWSSSDTSIATVDANGKVTAVKEGTVTITATCGDQKAEATVTVSASFVSVTSVTLNKTQAEIEVGKTDTLTATVKPDDATDKTVTWSSSDTSIATVDANGKVTAVKEGTVTITATCGDQTATCEITVKAQSSGGCNSFAGFSAGLAGLVLASAAFVLIRKRKVR